MDQDIRTLTAMGYTWQQAKSALDNNDTLEEAVSWLLDEHQMKEVPTHHHRKKKIVVSLSYSEDSVSSSTYENDYDKNREEIMRIKRKLMKINKRIKESEILSAPDQIIAKHSHLSNYQEKQELINIMIQKYLDNDPELVTELLFISDKLEETLQLFVKKTLEVKGNDGNILMEMRREKDTIEDNKREREELNKKELMKKKSSFIVPKRLNHNPLNTEAFDCSICFETIPIGKGYILSHCKHSFCQECLKEYLVNKIQDGLVLNIGCPDQNCLSSRNNEDDNNDKNKDDMNGGLGYYDVKDLVDDVNFKKYEEFCFIAALKTDPNMKWCPNPKGCNYAFIFNPDSKNKKLLCAECRYEFCRDCNEQYHTGTCEEFQKWKIDNAKVDAEFEKWKKSNTKPCPKCKARTQKNNGCNHMTCANCNYQWCWICDGKYTMSHFDFYNPLGCPGMQFDGDGQNNDPEVARAGHRKAMGRRVLAGVGLAVGIPILVPIGIGLVGVGIVIATPIAIVAGGIWGGYKVKKAITR